jgi:hypothetical protein
MIYQVRTRVFSGEAKIGDEISFEGIEPNKASLAMDTFHNLLGGSLTPDIRCRDINHHTTRFEITDVLHSACDGQAYLVELTVEVTVNLRLTLD